MTSLSWSDCKSDHFEGEIRVVTRPQEHGDAEDHNHGTGDERAERIPFARCHRTFYSLPEDDPRYDATDHEMMDLESRIVATPVVTRKELAAKLKFIRRQERGGTPFEPREVFDMILTVDAERVGPVAR
jgi:hypothetical protein